MTKEEATIAVFKALLENDKENARPKVLMQQTIDLVKAIYDVGPTEILYKSYTDIIKEAIGTDRLIMSMSTAHISEKDAIALHGLAKGNGEDIWKRETGFVLMVYEAMPIDTVFVGLSQEGKQLIQTCIDAGCSIIEFDGGALEIDGLPTYNW